MTVAVLLAWVDEAGLLQLRPDVYERDERVAAALAKLPSD